MQTIEDKAIEIYNKNIDYLSKEYPNVAEKLALLDILIEDGKYTNKYDLEYLDSYFDVKELKSGHYLYGENSISVSKELNRQVNYKKKSNIFEGFPVYYQYEKFQNMTDKTSALSAIYPLMTYYLDNTTDAQEMQLIEKFIFIGTGLGLHLREIHNKISATEYLIIEDDLELFKFSLFCTPYYEIGKDTKLYFSIALNDNEFINVFSLFLENSFFLNRYLKYSYFPQHSDKKIKLIQNVLSSQDFSTFPYKSFLTKQLRALEFLNNGYEIVNFMQEFKENIFSQKPVLIIAAGPSLQINLDWLKKNHSKFILIAVSSTLRILYQNSIRPDVVTNLDGFHGAIELFDIPKIKDFLKGTRFIFGSFTPPEVRKIFPKEDCFFFEEGTYYNEDFNSIVGPCIGSTTLFLATLLKTQELYLLGLDLAVDQESGRTHSSGHVITDNVDLTQKESLDYHTSFRGNTFAIKGNFRETIYTIPLFHISVQTINNKLPTIKNSFQNIYNLNDGAYLKTTIPMHIQDIDTQKLNTINKELLYHEIEIALKQNSKATLAQEDIISMQKRLKFIQKIKKQLEQYKFRVNYNSVDDYYYELFGLISNISNNQTREGLNISTTYYMYFKYTLPIIMDFFNTKGLKNSKKHLKKIDAMIQKEVFNIQDIYEKKLEEFLKRV